ncbi:MAG TPA: Rieske 2Fe-2S domain-containing protein [Pyrinomonadaceae bacterium]|nr:Rieske 2Fe-2S domain-containing protein [Pyrinomonadaceae bacterium]
MQSFDTKTDLRPGDCISLELPDGNEVAVYNVDGEFYATENYCPHKGARLTEGTLCGHIIECGLHGWQFDVRSGECLTVRDRIRTYRVTLDEQLIRVHLTADDAD